MCSVSLARAKQLMQAIEDEYERYRRSDLSRVTTAEEVWALCNTIVSLRAALQAYKEEW